MRWPLLILLLMPLAAAGTQTVLIDVGPEGIVREGVTLTFEADTAYDEIIYAVDEEPVAVIYDAPHTIRQEGDAWTISLPVNVTPGNNTVEFSLVLDGIVRRGRTNVAAIELTPTLEELTVRMTLPAGAVLAETDPAVIPAPDSIGTDGRRTWLEWKTQGPLRAIVLYQQPRASPMAWTLILIAILIIAAGTILYVRSHRKQALRATLTSDEQELVDRIRDGVDTQKRLVAQTGWSKSKMSKVVRRMEEKGVVEKRPHMRTNRLSLTKAWR